MAKGNNKVFVYSILQLLCVPFLMLSFYLTYLAGTKASERFFDFYISYLLTVIPGLAFGASIRLAIGSINVSRGTYYASKTFAPSILLPIITVLSVYLNVSMFTLGYHFRLSQYIIWAAIFIAAGIVSFLISLILIRK